MYILKPANLPPLGKEAYDALESAFGMEGFTEEQAIATIANAVGPKENATYIFRDLVRGGLVGTTDWKPIY